MNYYIKNFFKRLLFIFGVLALTIVMIFLCLPWTIFGFVGGILTWLFTGIDVKLVFWTIGWVPTTEAVCGYFYEKFIENKDNAFDEFKSYIKDAYTM